MTKDKNSEAYFAFLDLIVLKIGLEITKDVKDLKSILYITQSLYTSALETIMRSAKNTNNFDEGRQFFADMEDIVRKSLKEQELL